MFTDPSDYRRSGFTLVEIVMALGLCAFALIGLLGLLQVSLQTQKEATEESLVLDVSEWILRDIRQGPRPEAENEESEPKMPVSRIYEIPLAADATKEFFIGETGNPVDETSLEARFRVQTSISADERRVHLGFFPMVKSNPVPLLEFVANLATP